MLRALRLLLCLSLVLVAPVWATDYYVDQDGLGGACNDGNPGTISSPLCRVQAGVNRLGPGDTLYIRGGTYLVNINLAGLFGTAANHITLAGYQSERPVLMACLCGEGGGDPVDANNAVYSRGPMAYIDFTNLIFDGNQRIGTVGFVTVSGQQPHHIRYFNCEFRHSESEYTITAAHHIEFHGGSFHNFGNPNGLRHGIYCGSECNDLLVDGTEFYDIDAGYCIHVFADDVNHPAVTNTVIRNSLFHGCGKEQHQSAIVLTGVNQADVYNNVIWGSGGGGIYSCHGGSGFGGSDNVRVYHNTITANMVGTGLQGYYAIFLRCGSGHVVRNNIVYDNGGADINLRDSYQESNNLTSNPFFASAATHDYHLLSNSPAIGTGFFLGPPYDFDHEGHPFPNPPDVGAYAFGTTFSPGKGTYHVATTGSDGTDCATAVNNVGAPLATLAKAFSCAAGESTIYLRQGTYTQNIQTSTTPIAAGSSFTAPTLVASFPGETATLQPSSPGAIIGLDNALTDQYLVFDRLVLDGVNAASSTGFQVNAGSQHIRFQRGEIRRTVNNAVYLAGQTTEILQNQIHDNTSAGALIAMPGASNVIRGNTIFQGVSAGLFLFGGANNNLIEANAIRNNALRGLRFQGGSSNKAFNNLIYSNGGDGIVVESNETGLTLYHNTVWSNTAFGLNILSGSSTAYTNNIFAQNGNDTPSNGGSGTLNTTNVFGSPGFIAPGPPATFHVEGANAVHAGTTLAAVTTDFAGKGRSSTPGYTIGAYQDDVVGSGGPPPGPQLAFPTAEGWGRFAKGGRGGKAYNINSLSRSAGSGGSCNAGGCSGGEITLSDCMTDRFGVGARTCIFRIGGLIDFSDNGTRKCERCADATPFLTVAGQTAPGDGIMIRGMEFGMSNTHDIIVRHLRLRAGNTPFNDQGSMGTIGYTNPTHDVIFDHFSVGWAPDDTIESDGWNFTFQWGIVSEGLGYCQTLPEPYCDTSKAQGTDGGDDRTSQGEPVGVSLLHNYYAHMEKRLPIIGGGRVQIVNSMIYNSGGSGIMVFFAQSGRNRGDLELVNNYWVSGPDNNNGHPWVTLLACGNGNNCPEVQASRVYLSGNYHSLHRPDNSSPETDVIEGDPPWDPQVVSTPFGDPFPPVPSQVSAQQAHTDLLARAGAYAVAGGGMSPRRDLIDQRSIDSSACGLSGSCLAGYYPSGAYDTQTTDSYAGPATDAHGWPTYNNGTPYPDTDGDGIADDWETAHGLNPTDAADGPALASNGYSNLENFINELAGDGAPLGTPPSVSLIATPSSITTGGSSTLSWTSTSVTSCSAPWTASTATAGSQSVSPTTTTTYTITCTDGTTSVESSAAVLVAGIPAVSLTAIPQSITAGDTATLSWTSTNVTSCSAPWTASTATVGSQNVAPITTTTYTITCTDGTTPVTSNTTVTVTPRPGPGVRGLPYASSGFFVMP